MTPPVFLTGATGFVGMEVLARQVELGDDVVALVRAADDAAREDRLYGVLVCAFRDPSRYLGRVRAVAGDITHEGLGLDPDVALEVAARVSEIGALRGVGVLRPAAAARR